ncbi:MAG: hypothetical protein SOX72_03590 [Oscillospiraceae bacterium]|nr:hypothetical protein [Oscillospiraceae bacterium]
MRKNDRISRVFHRGMAVLLAGAMTFGGALTVCAETGPELPLGYDEAYYATLDYYGGLTEGGVVKSYRLRGRDKIVDYGVYDEVNNLTDGTEPKQSGNEITFSFDREAPETFYFEGKTAEPYKKLPWNISLSYRMNGVPVRAEEMAGQRGMAEIDLDIVPNENASDYSKQNFVLMASTAFNDDDILSLSAPGAQVQLVGNLRTVIFMALPGEEQHFTLQVGSEDFSFSGMVLMMMPATLSQLQQVADLKEAKDEAEDSYDALNESFDVILNSLEGMGGNLEAAAKGLDELNRAREVISDSTDGLYEKLDDVIEDMDDLQGSVGSLRGHLTDADRAASDISDCLAGLYAGIGDVRKDLQACMEAMDALQEGGEGEASALESLAKSLDDLRRDSASLQKLADEIQEAELAVQPEGMTSEEVQETLRTTAEFYKAYLQAGGTEGDMTQFYDFLSAALVGRGYPEEQAKETAADMISLFEANAAIEDVNTQSKKLQQLAGSAGLSEDLNSAVQIAGDVSDLCASLEKIMAAAEGGDAQDGSAAHLMESADALLGRIQKMIYTTGAYEDDLHDTIDDSKRAAKEVKALLKDLRGFLIRGETAAKDAEHYLDNGTKKTLVNLAESLRKAASGLGQTDVIRGAKDTITDLIDDKWEEHTGKTDNLLLIDPDAEKQSLTDARNGEPESIQIVLRTQEIKEEKEKAPDAEKAAPEKATFLSRVGDMFRDLWNMITGIFH